MCERDGAPPVFEGVTDRAGLADFVATTTAAATVSASVRRFSEASTLRSYAASKLSERSPAYGCVVNIGWSTAAAALAELRRLDSPATAHATSNDSVRNSDGRMLHG